jgi:hypothetical protein
VSDDPGEAAAMLGRAGELRRRYGRPPSGSEEAASASTASAARRALGGAEYAEAIRRGAARGLNGGL